MWNLAHFPQAGDPLPGASLITSQSVLCEHFLQEPWRAHPSPPPPGEKDLVPVIMLSLWVAGEGRESALRMGLGCLAAWWDWGWGGDAHSCQWFPRVSQPLSSSLGGLRPGRPLTPPA